MLLVGDTPTPGQDYYLIILGEPVNVTVQLANGESAETESVRLTVEQARDLIAHLVAAIPPAEDTSDAG